MNPKRFPAHRKKGMCLYLLQLSFKNASTTVNNCCSCNKKKGQDAHEVATQLQYTETSFVSKVSCRTPKVLICLLNFPQVMKVETNSLLASPVMILSKCGCMYIHGSTAFKLYIVSLLQSVSPLFLQMSVVACQQLNYT